MASNRTHRLGHAATLTLLFTVGCVSPTPLLSADQALSIQNELYHRAAQRFDNAAYYKPRDGAMGAPIDALAPLVVQQLPADMAADNILRVQFGAVLEGHNGAISADPALPTLYARYQSADPESATCAWVVFVWGYQATEPATDAVFRGLKMTLDRDGYPVVYEALGGRTGSRCGPNSPHSIFVDAEVEATAVVRFGQPLSGRRFSIEPSIQQAPDLFVAGLLDRGPIPMGPYVYLDYPRSVATTVLCRCSPSQVDRFQVERWYDLRDLGELDGLGIPMVDAFLHPRQGRTGSAATRSPARDITQRLRWPGRPDAPIGAPGASLVTPRRGTSEG